HWAVWDQRQAERRQEILRRVRGRSCNVGRDRERVRQQDAGPGMVERLVSDDAARGRLLRDLDLATD
ncbi:MAG: hypothetical protein PHH26_07645, partial [Candidatus Thermoplasmatota archaeon]|nr:hypothetical protein [Candidatus Thermoplasmatota archaeon]